VSTPTENFLESGTVAQNPAESQISLSLAAATSSLPSAVDDDHGSIWDRAYRRLRHETPELVSAYEEILAKNADVQDDLPLAQKMSAIIAKELYIITNRQWKFCIPWPFSFETWSTRLVESLKNFRPLVPLQ
jgi:hypothetical protein